MEVGTDCCDNLTGSLEASEHLDGYKKRADKVKRFVSSPRWKLRGPGELKIKQDGIYVVIRPNGEGFKVSMEGVTGKADFPTLLDAKMRVFEIIESGEAAQFLAKRNAKLVSQSNGPRYR